MGGLAARDASQAAPRQCQGSLAAASTPAGVWSNLRSHAGGGALEVAVGAVSRVGDAVPVAAAGLLRRIDIRQVEGEGGQNHQAVAHHRNDEACGREAARGMEFACVSIPAGMAITVARSVHRAGTARAMCT